jgi:hypothetical protein
MSNPQNGLFTAWDSTPYNTDLVKVQSIVDYCASRFKAAATALSRVPVETREEAEKFVNCFSKEVVCVFSTGQILVSNY